MKKTIDFTREGGFPFTQDTLDFMQSAYRSILQTLIGYLGVPTSGYYIISGVQTSGSNLTAGWVVINGEVLPFKQGVKGSSPRIKIEESRIAVDYQNQPNQEPYIERWAKVSQTQGQALTSFSRIKQPADFLPRNEADFVKLNGSSSMLGTLDLNGHNLRFTGQVQGSGNWDGIKFDDGSTSQLQPGTFDFMDDVDDNNPAVTGNANLRAGKLGLGTTPGDASLHIKKSRAIAMLENTNASQWSFLRIKGSGMNFWDIAQFGDNSRLEFRPKGSNTNAMSVHQNGSVGISTLSPAQKFHVNGGRMRIQSPSGYGDIGAANTSWFHFGTDRPNFHFNKGLRADGDVGLYNRNTYMRASDSALISAGHIYANNHIYGRSVNGQYSNLYRFGGLYFTWDSDSHGTNTHHSIRSTYGDTYGDNLTINSFNHLRVNLDSNNNNSGSKFEIGHGTTTTDNTIFYVNDAGFLYTHGDIQANGAYYKGNGKNVIQFSDSWLRLNPSNNFSSGIHCANSILRTDRQLEVGGGGESFKANSSGAWVKGKPVMTYLRKARYYLGNPDTDQTYTISFPSVGTTNYFVIGNLQSNNSNWDRSNDVILTIGSKSSTSFRVHLREVSPAQQMYFDYAIIPF